MKKIKNITEGMRVEIISKESTYYGEWGIVRYIDGYDYHVALWNDPNSALVFDREEIVAYKI